ncbi:MAG TPA: right-handed parallel beta-helix repeat-containing protein, partial [Armatimonadota bacterium]|nr:right-handed parallel beta-helix repeat-containing protein [Armatimonadota bacterium]
MRNWNPGALWRTSLLCAAALAGSLLPVAAAPLSLYVSPNGDDTSTGTAPMPRAATAAGRVGPFATLQRAQTELRALKAAGKLPEGAVVYVRGGIYPLAQTLAFGPEDSGTATHPILYRPYLNEKPILAGARIINGFHPYKGGILRCDLKAAGLGTLRFHQLFFRGERMTLARTPNADPKDPHGGAWAHVMGEIGAGNKREFKYGDPVTGMWARPQEGEICLFPSYDWAWNILPLKSVDREKQTITLGRDASYPLRVGDRYFVQNLFEALDSPGEWYLDTQTATLYFWPPAALIGGQVLAPVLDSVVTLKGAQYVTLQGFTLEACDGDAAQMTDCQGCTVTGCVVRNCGKWGVNITGGQQNGAFGNDIYAA